MLDKFKKILKQEKPKAKAKPKVNDKKKPTVAKTPKASAKPKLDPKNPKDAATLKNEPWVTVLSMEIDTANPSQGAFELDWNDIFVARLIKAGYQGRTDQDIVDNWFRAVCSNVVMENYEQEQADPSNRVTRRDLGNGRTEIS
jgi:hypothetical protein